MKRWGEFFTRSDIGPEYDRRWKSALEKKFAKMSEDEKKHYDILLTQYKD